MISEGAAKMWGRRGYDRDDPIFEISFEKDIVYPNGDKLPPIWITEPVFDDEGNATGRTYAMFYPWHDDPEGDNALFYGSRYYEEGMGYTSAHDHKKRIDCFRAAEMFYRHAAGQGSAIAYLFLGYIYGYDRCEGRY